MVDKYVPQVQTCVRCGADELLGMTIHPSNHGEWAKETPPKYGTCPECGGMGGAHLTSCRHSPTQAETKGESGG